MATVNIIIRVDLDRLTRVLAAGAALLWILFGIVLYGEYVGWWNDLGEIVGSALGAGGVVATILALIVAATKGQARSIAQGVAESNRKHDDGNLKLDHLVNQSTEANRKLDHLVNQSTEANRKMDHLVEQSAQSNRKLDETNALLRDIRDRLAGGAPTGSR